jgi:hypothetical protein
MTWTKHVAYVQDRRNVYRVFVGKHEGRRPLARTNIHAMMMAMTHV